MRVDVKAPSPAAGSVHEPMAPLKAIDALFR